MATAVKVFKPGTYFHDGKDLWRVLQSNKGGEVIGENASGDLVVRRFHESEIQHWKLVETGET